MSDCRTAEAKIQPRLRELTDTWDALMLDCKEKKSRLQEAYQVGTLTFSRLAAFISCVYKRTCLLLRLYRRCSSSALWTTWSSGWAPWRDSWPVWTVAVTFRRSAGC